MNEIDRIERRLKLHDMRVLMSVVQAGSMSKAAERLGTAQPALSRSIAELEHALGVRLLDRSPRGVEPTAYGRALIKRGVAVFDELRQGVKDIEFLADPTAGELRIGTTESMADGPVLAVIDRLSRQYPRISVHLVMGYVEGLCDQLIERKIELVIIRIAKSIFDRQLAVEELFDDPYVVAAGVQNPWTRRVQLAELVKERWVLLPFDSPAGSIMAQAFRASGVEPPRATVFTHSLNLRYKLLATGRFLSSLPRFSLTLPSRPASIKALPLELPGTRRPMGIITLKGRTPSPLAQRFIERLRGVVKPLRDAK